MLVDVCVSSPRFFVFLSGSNNGAFHVGMSLRLRPSLLLPPTTTLLLLLLLLLPAPPAAVVVSVGAGGLLLSCSSVALLLLLADEEGASSPPSGAIAEVRLGLRAARRQLAQRTVTLTGGRNSVVSVGQTSNARGQTV